MKKWIYIVMVAGFVISGCSKGTIAPAENPETVDATNENAKSPEANAQKDDSKAAKPDIEAKLNENIKANKAAEAKQNLKAIGYGAIAFFESEHMRDDESTMYTKEYPKSEAVQIGPRVDDTTIDAKYTPKEADFTQVWKRLYFHASTPLYYTYYYISDGKTFKAKAAASITKACDSVFIIEGDANGVLSDVKDVSDSGNCDSLALP
ncbi:MAG: hypothetical protein IJ165_05025 [Proteobacteria bacterium]|nr:hypothetical protein [Pseudomonadota bacterium]